MTDISVLSAELRKEAKTGLQIRGLTNSWQQEVIEEYKRLWLPVEVVEVENKRIVEIIEKWLQESIRCYKNKEEDKDVRVTQATVAGALTDVLRLLKGKKKKG